MAEFEKKVRDILSANNCRFVRHGKGDHDISRAIESCETIGVSVSDHFREVTKMISIIHG